MKKIFLLITLSAITSILHAAEQEPWQSWDSNGNATIAPYLLTQSDEFYADASAFMTVESDTDSISTIAYNNGTQPTNDAFISTEQELVEVLSYTFYPSFIPQTTFVYHDYITVFSSSTTIAKTVEKLQKHHQERDKRGMLLCSYCHWSTKNETSMEEHTFTNKHRDNAGQPRALWYEEKCPCEICKIGFYREGGIEKHNKCEAHLKKMVEIMDAAQHALKDIFL